jgi:methyl-accepting chemotaxis protein
VQLILTALALSIAVLFAVLYLLARKKASAFAADGSTTNDSETPILNTIGMPVMKIDKEYNILFVNDAAASLGGRSPATYVGTKCYDLFKTGHCQTENCALFKAMRDDKITQERTSAKPKPGLEIPIMYFGAPSKNADGIIDGAIEYVQDITLLTETQIEVQNNSKYLGSAVEDLSTLTRDAGVQAEEVSIQSSEVASSAEQMSGNFTTVSSAVEETHGIFRSIASATEEMSSSIGEIARSVTSASSTTEEAVRHSGNLSNRVEELNTASKEVGSIINTIVSISEKTTLLALNATIEAARAGEYGKGFAVVANEVKDLATQTNDAISDIQVKVDNITNTTQATSENIGEINSSIDEISHSVTTIASAMEEQDATTQEITRNINEAVLGMNDVTKNIEEASQAAHNISDRITTVNDGMKSIDSAFSNLSGATQSLGELSSSLGTVAEKLSE